MTPLGIHRTARRRSGRRAATALLCAALVPAFVLAGSVRADCPECVRSVDGEFAVGGAPLRFVGFNLRGICHYGQGDVLPYSYVADRATNLNAVQAIGGKVIRVFVAYNALSPQQTGNRLAVVLDEAWDRGIRLIVAFTDMYGGTGLHPKGDTIYFVPSGGYDLLNHTFFVSGYRDNYLPQALYLANRFRDHPGVFAWELGNEIRDLSSGQTFVAFCLDVATQIRTVDPNHMVGAGLISHNTSNLSWSQAVQIFSSLDYCTSHNYNGSDYENDASLAATVGKPFIIEEAGFSGSDRPARTSADIAKWIGRGAAGYMQWGLMAGAYDNGDGDRYVGMDRVFFSDFNDYVLMYSQWAEALRPLVPRIHHTPTAFVAETPHGRSPPTQLLSVSNAGHDTLRYTVTTNAPWLQVVPASGTSTGETDTLGVVFNAVAMLPGEYNGVITIADPGAENSPQTATVHLTIHALPPDFDADGDVDLSDFAFLQLCFNGPDRGLVFAECAVADMDADDDVDLSDFAVFLGCFNGPARPPSPGCV